MLYPKVRYWQNKYKNSSEASFVFSSQHENGKHHWQLGGGYSGSIIYPSSNDRNSMSIHYYAGRHRHIAGRVCVIICIKCSSTRQQLEGEEHSLHVWHPTWTRSCCHQRLASCQWVHTVYVTQKCKTQIWKDSDSDVGETKKEGSFNALHVIPTVTEPDERKKSESIVSHLLVSESVVVILFY